MRLKLALIAVGVLAAIAVTGAAAADFEHDEGPCFETPGEALLGRCPTGNVGAEYEIQIVSEDGSGCEPYDYFELRLEGFRRASRLREGASSPAFPRAVGFGASGFTIVTRPSPRADLTGATRDDKSEREFSIHDRPRTCDCQRIRQAGQRRPALFRDTHGQAGHDPEPAHRQRRAGVVVGGIGRASAGPHALAAGSAHRDAHV